MTDALIVIDMQQGSFGEVAQRHDAEGLVGRLNELAGAVRRNGGAVVFIQHDGPAGDPGTVDLGLFEHSFDVVGDVEIT